jgi:hypothetical protein
MTPTRVLSFVLLALSVPAFTQAQKPDNQPASTAGTMEERAKRLLEAIPFDPNSQTLSFVIRANGETVAWVQDKTCYAIRSYVVARDGKDTDSTHPVSYSTCRPASRYHVKNVEAQSGSSH